MKKYSKRILAFLCAIALTVTTVLGSGAIRQTQAADTEPTPVELDGFTNVIPSDLVYEGTTNPMEEKTYQGGSNLFYGFQLKEGTNFDKKLFTAYVKYDPSAYWQTRICIGGSWTVRGLALCVSPDGNTMYIHDWGNGGYEFSPSFEEKTITATEAGVTSFKDEFLLQMGYEYLANNAVRVLVYVNGNNVLDTTIENCDTANFLGNYVGFYTETANDSVTIRSYQPKVEPTPVELDGFTNVAPGDLVYEGTTNPMEEKTYQGGSNLFYGFQLKEGTNFDKKLFTAYVKYDPSAYWQTRICIGGSWTVRGLALCVSPDGNTMYIHDWGNGGYEFSPSFEEKTITATEAGVTSFRDEFLLQMGYEYLANNAVRVLVYVNGNNVLDTTIENCDTANFLGNYVGFYTETANDSVTIRSYQPKVEPTPVELEGFTNVTVGDFVYAGTTNPMEEKEYTSDAAFTLKNGSDFNKKLFTAKIKITDPTNANWWSNRLYIGGTASNGWGLALCVDGANNVLKLAELDSNIDGNANENFTRDITASAAKVDSFLNTELILQVGFEYLDNDNGGTANDVRVLVYVDGNAAFNEVFSNCNIDRLGNYIRTYFETEYKIQIGAVGSSEETPDDDPIMPSDDLTKITFAHFGIEDDTYYPNGDLVVKGTYADNTSLDNTLLSGTVELTGSDWFQLILGGSADTEWDGLRLITGNANSMDLKMFKGTAEEKIITFTSEKAGVDFIGEAYDLMISTEFVAADADGVENDIKLGFWFEDVLYENQYIIISNRADELLNKFSAYCSASGASVTLNSDAALVPAPGPEDDEPEQGGEEEPTVPDETFERITFGSFGIDDGTYRRDTEDYTYDGSLNQKVLCGKVQFVGEEYFVIRLGGKADSWDTGLYLAPRADGNMEVKWRKNYEVVEDFALFTSAEAGVDLVGETAYDLMISIEVVEGTNDVKFGIWFNNELYGGRYYTVEDVADTLGNRFAMSIPSGTVTLNSVPEYLPEPDEDETPTGPIKPSDELEKITFADFGIKDGKYQYIPGEIVVQSSLSGRDTLDKTLLCGDILLDGENFFQLILGGKGNSWDGMRLFINTDGSMSLLGPKSCEHKEIAKLYPGDDGNVYVGEEFNLMWSTEFVDNDGDGQKNDIKVGLWFNDVLYQNKYIIIPDSTEGLGTIFAASCAVEDASVTLNSIAELVDPPKQPNEDFEKITFEYFSIADGTYKYTGSNEPTCEGRGRDTMNEKVFCGDFLFTGEGGNQFMIGGNGNAWYGFCFIVAEDGKIALLWIDEEGAVKLEEYDPVTAGTPLVGEWLNLMISTEIVDADGDGAEDDIQLGVWFNGALYKEAFTTVLNKASGLGDCFGMYSGREGSAIAIRSIPEYIKGFDYAVFGLTKDWEKTLLGTGFKAEIATGGSRDAEPFTGDLLETGMACVFGAVALMAIAAVAYIILQKKKES